MPRTAIKPLLRFSFGGAPQLPCSSRVQPPSPGVLAILGGEVLGASTLSRSEGVRVEPLPTAKATGHWASFFLDPLALILLHFAY
jgi:hypothetical protein